MEIREIGIVGCGLMGSGIAQIAAVAGFPTTVAEATQELCERGMSGIAKRLDRLVEKGSLAAGERDVVSKRLRATTELSRLSHCDLVIEAITENPEEKLNLWRALDPLLRPEAIRASNTSSVSITQMMMATSRPERFLGMHFFNPVPVMTLVELVKTLVTDPEVYESAAAFTRKLGKTAVHTTDRPGFIVNRLLIPYLTDAIRALEEGVGSITDIDKAMKLGCNHPMGPLTLADFTGLDICHNVAEIMFREFRETRYAPPPLLKRLILLGHLGRKTGRGFYDYSVNPPKPANLGL